LLLKNAAPLPIDGDQVADHRIAQPDAFLFDGLLAFGLPLYVRLIVVWTDRRLGRNHPPLPAQMMAGRERGFVGEPDPIPSRCFSN
jgi:hypothetical protein